MEISKKELRKISRKFRTLASNVMNSYYGEQNANLEEMINYIEQTSLIKEYLHSLEYDVDGLDDLLNTISNSYGRKVLNLGNDSNKRTYLLYRAFSFITGNNLPTYTFGWYYAGSNKYQDMAKAFGDRMVYPFVVEIENYMKDISTDMGYDEDNALYKINVNSSGVQVNIAEHGSTISATQENKFTSEDVTKAISNVEELIKGMEDESSKSILSQNLDSIKNEIKQKKPKKELLVTCLKSMNFIATSVALIPDLTLGIQMIASSMGLSI
ncbi:TPA: conjugal transfer protein [Streptococcus agalactiae]|nr:conjugal transfer protein [Streptococcus agalactiae]HEN0774428.1 conjugal transfer protein [Streptococcus agalactiae]